MKYLLTTIAFLSFSPATFAENVDFNDPQVQQEALKKAQEMLNDPKTKAQLQEAMSDPEMQQRVNQVLQDPDVQKLLQQHNATQGQ